MTRSWPQLILTMAVLAAALGTGVAQEGSSKEQIAKILKEREGNLKPGDTAPKFKLKTLDGKSEVELAGLLKGKKPIVLVFGSYT